MVKPGYQRDPKDVAGMSGQESFEAGVKPLRRVRESWRSVNDLMDRVASKIEWCAQQGWGNCGLEKQQKLRE